MRAAEAAERILRSLAEGAAVVEVVVTGAEDAPTRPGARMLVRARDREGSLGDPALDGLAEEMAREVLSGGRAGSREVALGEGACTLYLEPHRPPEQLVIVGAGHIARPLCRIGAMLGFEVVVLDDRPAFATGERFPEASRLVRADFSDPFRDVALGERSYVVLVTRGHKYDFDALRDILQRPVAPAYVGMVGSRRRVRAAFEQIAREGIPAERLRHVHSPIGLDVGAETPEEIAVAIAAELVLARRGGTGAPLRDRARVVDRWMK
jgi:xanthine dehydrogenase accessory factor